MKYFRFTILLLVFAIGCQKNALNSKSNVVETINIEEGLKSEGNPMRISEIAKDIQYVFLETSKECLVDNVDKIMIDNDLIFIYSKKQFLIFNVSGKFERRIGRVGKGPGEYIRIMDFTINSSEKKIYIYDSDQKKVLSFNYNGDLNAEFKLNSYPTCITCVDDKYLALSWVKPDFIRNENYGLSYYTLDGQLICKEFNREDENAEESMPSTFLTRLNYYCDSLTYWEVNLDVVYRIDKDKKMIPRYQIDYTKNKDSKDMSKISQEVFRCSYFLETEKNLYFLRGVYNNKIKHLIFNKQTKECHNLSFEFKNDLNLQLEAGFTNDFDGGYPFLPYDVLKDGRIYDTFYPYQLKNLIKQNIYEGITILNQQKQKDLYNRINNSTVMDNPIIMLVSLK